MGIFINLYMIPQRISPQGWQSVYRESLKLVNAYGFMDRLAAERNGRQYFYAGRTEDRENLFGRGFRGWRSVGDMRTGFNTEDYILYGDIHAYLPKLPAEDNGADILLSALPDMEGIEKPEGCINIWGNKSQGEDSHIYLLAVACLITDRFPDAAMVSGDISAGQCRRAVRWANQYLEKPIQLPDTGQMERLLRRLRRAAIRTSISSGRLLEAFYRLTDEAKNLKMGVFLREEFRREELYAYYRERFRKYQPGQRGFIILMKEYLEMGFSFEDLCRLAVEDPEGMRGDPEEFLKCVLESKLYVKEKETWDFTKLSTDRADREETDDIRRMFARVVGTLCGAGNRNVDAFYPLEQIREDCREVFGYRCAVDTVIENILENVVAGPAQQPENEKRCQDGPESLQSLLYDRPDGIFHQEAVRMEEKRRQAERYDINAYGELIDFVPGCSVRPELEEDLMRNFRMLHEFAEKDFEEFRILNKEERENFFIRSNRYILLREEVWDRIFGQVMNDEYIRRMYGIFCVDCSRMEGYKFCRNLLTNLSAIDYYWDKTS